MLEYLPCPYCGNKSSTKRRYCDQCKRHIRGLPDEKLDPAREAQLLQQAEARYKRKDFAEGKKLVDEVLTVHPENEEAKRMLRLYYGWGKESEKLIFRRKMFLWVGVALFVGVIIWHSL